MIALGLESEEELIILRMGLLLRVAVLSQNLVEHQSPDFAFNCVAVKKTKILLAKVERKIQLLRKIAKRGG